MPALADNKTPVAPAQATPDPTFHPALHPAKAKPNNGDGVVSATAGGNHIIDIRRDREEQSLYKAILDGLNPKGATEKRLPTLLLYDEAGLKLFESITYLDEYYLTNAEIAILEAHADDIARALQPGSIVLELGSGNLRKVSILLDALERSGKSVDYYALDLSLSELERTLAEVPSGTYRHVKCYGLHGTYDDGLEWLKTAEIKPKTKTVLWLGSSIGNFSRREAADFLHNFTRALEPFDTMLVAVDACKDSERVYHAYNDSEGITHRFYANGLLNANRILGGEVFDLQKWDILGRFDSSVGRHEAFVVPKQDISIDKLFIRRGEKVRLEEAYKYDAEDLITLWEDSDVGAVRSWAKEGRDYAIHMIMKNNFALPTSRELYASQPVPTLDEWARLWNLWDAATRRMLPDEELLEKPIKLRNACIFYLGHIPTFFDMKLTDMTGSKPTPPDYFPKIFERGIDPDVENPEQCHAHSEIPDEWPPLNEILAFQDRVRERVRNLYKSGEAYVPQVARAMWLGYEHEAMHLETFLYMLIQSEKTLPPPDSGTPNFELMASKAKVNAVANEWFTIPERDVVLGLDDPEDVSGPERHFGWDIEKPSRQIHVKAFQAKARPITIGEYASYLHQTGKSRVPASWIEKHASVNTAANGTNGRINGDHAANAFLSSYSVRTVYGSVLLKYAQSWPVSASYDELNGCAVWMGGRIPTVEETRSIYEYAIQLGQDPAHKALGGMIPAVNGHLVNDGVEETPPYSLSNGGAGAAKSSSSDTHVGKVLPEGVFVDLHGCNVGFNNWHPTPVTQNGGQLAGQGGMGGLWEWTSTPLSPHQGYAEMPLYPAYSSDFFDGKHNIVLGGSWATVPRIAGRKSFVNWYQRNYPYVWAGARLVRDIE